MDDLVVGDGDWRAWCECTAAFFTQHEAVRLDTLTIPDLVGMNGDGTGAMWTWSKQDLG